MKILVIGAHPDDELLGCGGTISKHIKSGDSVDICIVTSTDESKWPIEYKVNKRREAKLVDEILKIDKRYYCDLPTTTLKSLPSYKINDAIQRVINKSKPDIIYTHFKNDVNDDHREIFNAVMVCTRPIKNYITVRCFETLSSTEWGFEGFRPNFYVALTLEDIDKKNIAFEQYKSEVKIYPHPRSKKGIINLAKKRGNEICHEYAESFITISEYWV